MKKIVLKYLETPTGDFTSGAYVALDANSGGYPYGTTALKAEGWKTVEAAVDYVSHFESGKFAVVELNIQITETLLVPVVNKE